MIQHIAGGLFLLWLAVDSFWVVYHMLTHPVQPYCLSTENMESKLKRLDKELALLDNELDHPENLLEWSVKKSTI